MPPRHKYDATALAASLATCRRCAAGLLDNAEPYQRKRPSQIIPEISRWRHGKAEHEDQQKRSQTSVVAFARACWMPSTGAEQQCC